MYFINRKKNTWQWTVTKRHKETILENDETNIAQENFNYTEFLKNI